MKVLVTGATSLLGRATVDRLTRNGHDVTAFQRGASGLPVAEVRGDLCSSSDVERAMQAQQGVIHLAARVGVTGAWPDFERTNVKGTARLIDAARAAGVERMVHVSSPSVAHSGSVLIGAGAGPADPDSTRGHYATSKAEAEILALRESSSDFPIVVIRPHLVWGPGDQQLVARIVDRARRGRLAFVGTGLALIDSTYVDNAADALVEALAAAPRLAGRAFVVSNGEPRTVRELVGRIVTAAGLTPPRRSVPVKVAFGGGVLVERVWDRHGLTGDPPMTSFLAEQLSTAHWFDQRGTRAALDWVPAVTLDEGFERLASWYQASPRPSMRA